MKDQLVKFQYKFIEYYIRESHLNLEICQSIRSFDLSDWSLLSMSEVAIDIKENVVIKYRFGLMESIPSNFNEVYKDY